MAKRRWNSPRPHTPSRTRRRRWCSPRRHDSRWMANEDAIAADIRGVLIEQYPEAAEVAEASLALARYRARTPRGTDEAIRLLEDLIANRPNAAVVPDARVELQRLRGRRLMTRRTGQRCSASPSCCLHVLGRAPGGAVGAVVARAHGSVSAGSPEGVWSDLLDAGPAGKGRVVAELPRRVIPAARPRRHSQGGGVSGV